VIIYRSNKAGFQSDVSAGKIDQAILDQFQIKLNRKIAEKEVDSWWNSMQFMSNILHDKEIPENTGVAIECQIPQTSKRIDFILSGRDQNKKENIIIIELKQWKSAEITEKDGIVRTALGKGLRETSHPSYQAWTYASMLTDFSTTIQEDQITLYPCAYLHNYVDDNVIRSDFYKEYTSKAPVFLKRDTEELRKFIKRFVTEGDDGEIMYRVDQGKIRPSKQLAESLVGMIKGNQEFLMIDEQKLVYETALHLTKQSQKGNKNVLIVEGGPGTGKSVVAINLLVEITNRELLIQYVSKNSAPREVYQSKLTGTLTKTRFSNLFKGSGSYFDVKNNQFDALVVDEAHRLNQKSGMFQNLGENQVKEIINASRTAIFFIDEDQRISLKDIGTKKEIKKHAKALNAEVHELELSSQFRCNGSDGYLSFLDNLLQSRETANTDLSNIDYEFKLFDNPSDLRKAITEKNKINNKARLVAGYCWDWVSKKDSKAKDIVFEEFDFAMKWNLSEDGMLWILKEDSVNEVGCIHTCQGLEVDYIGVIIGEDLIVRNGIMLVDPSKRSKMDSTIKGYKSLLKKSEPEAKNLIKTIIKNTYRTLMTRGMKGCFVWAADEETNAWLKQFSK
jgi:DUF2075 family protein